jgi:hypothetical protein
MCHRRLRDLKRSLIALAAAYGAEVEIRTSGGNHLAAVFKVGDSQIAVYVASTPGDFRSLGNEHARVRRILRQIVPA